MAYRTSCGTNNPAGSRNPESPDCSAHNRDRINSACNERSQYRAGNDGRIPGRVIEIRPRQRLSRCIEARCGTQPPGVEHPRLPGSRLQARASSAPRARARAHPAALGMRQSPWVLRLEKTRQARSCQGHPTPTASKAVTEKSGRDCASVRTSCAPSAAAVIDHSAKEPPKCGRNSARG